MNFIKNKHCGFIEFRVKISIYHWLYNSGRAFYLFSDFVMMYEMLSVNVWDADTAAGLYSRVVGLCTALLCIL